MPGKHLGWKKKFNKFNFEDNQIAVASIKNDQDATAVANASTGVVISKKGGPLETGPGDLYIIAKGTGDATATATATNTVDDQVAVAANLDV